MNGSWRAERSRAESLTMRVGAWKNRIANQLKSSSRSPPALAGFGGGGLAEVAEELAEKAAENGSAEEDELGPPNGSDEEEEADEEKGEDEEDADWGGGMWREEPDDGGGGNRPMPLQKPAPPVGCGRCVEERAPSASSPAFPLIFLVCTHIRQNNRQLVLNWIRFL